MELWLVCCNQKKIANKYFCQAVSAMCTNPIIKLLLPFIVSLVSKGPSQLVQLSVQYTSAKVADRCPDLDTWQNHTGPIPTESILCRACKASLCRALYGIGSFSKLPFGTWVLSQAHTTMNEQYALLSQPI